MKAQYIKSGSVYFALNFKAATSSIVRAIVSAHYPDIEDNLLNNTSYPEGVTIDNSRWHSQLPKTETPDGDTILVVRDPVERFRSACAETGKTPDEALSEQGQKNNHLWPTSRLLVDRCKLYRFETDLEDAATALGLSLPLPNIDGGNGAKPELTSEQLSRVQEIYADDITLYESITEVGQVWIKPPTPVTEEARAKKIEEIKRARKVAENAGVEVEPFGLIPTDAETQRKLTAVYVKALNDPTYTKEWKVGPTTWATLDSAAIIAIGDAVEDHIQAQFDKEKTLTEEALNVASLEELLAINW